MNLKTRLFFLCGLLCMTSAVSAQDQGVNYSNLSVPVLIPAPPATKDGQPVAPPIGQPGVVPDLPLSRACTAADLVGTWKLLQLYEEPIGPETAAFYAMPSQYIKFSTDSRFAVYDRERDTRVSLDAILEAMAGNALGLQQYVVQNNGQVYFYRDSVVFKQAACFVVVTGNSTFTAGQMLLMPPNPQSPTRWVKLYSKIWTADSGSSQNSDSSISRSNRQ